MHPRKVIYEPKITGKVSDELGNPIENAKVVRIEEKYFKNKEFGNEEIEEFESQSALTDKDGNFVLNEKSRTEWIHNIPFTLPVVWCNGQFKVSKKGFMTYRSTSDAYEKYNKKYNFCEGIEFKTEIVLNKL